MDYTATTVESRSLTEPLSLHCFTKELHHSFLHIFFIALKRVIFDQFLVRICLAAVYSVVKAKYAYIFIRSLALTALGLNIAWSMILAVIGVGLSAPGLIILGYLTSVQMAGKATEVVLDRTTVGAMQSVSFSNPHIVKGEELFLLARVASSPTAQPDDTLKVQLIGPNGQILLEREFDSSFAAAPMSNTGGSHHVVITNLEDKDLEVYATLRVRDAAWVNTDWPSAMALAGIAIIASAMVRFRSSSKTSKIL